MVLSLSLSQKASMTSLPFIKKTSNLAKSDYKIVYTFLVYIKRNLSALPQYLINTFDSRYLEVEGTLWNSSRYPYYDISELQKWDKIQIEQPNFTNSYIIWLLNLEMYFENIAEKGWNCSSGVTSPLIHNILPDIRFLRLKKDQIFSSR